MRTLRETAMLARDMIAALSPDHVLDAAPLPAWSCMGGRLDSITTTFPDEAPRLSAGACTSWLRFVDRLPTYAA
jgi:hypothetical protein